MLSILPNLTKTNFPIILSSMSLCVKITVGPMESSWLLRLTGWRRALPTLLPCCFLLSASWYSRDVKAASGSLSSALHEPWWHRRTRLKSLFPWCETATPLSGWTPWPRVSDPVIKPDEERPREADGVKEGQGEQGKREEGRDQRGRTRAGRRHATAACSLPC